MDYISSAICLVAGYLLGNIQTAVLLSRLSFNDDVRNHGSGNSGATNMARVYGIKHGLITFIGDALKGVLAALVGFWIYGTPGMYVCGLGVVLGHDFPAFFKFRGGKGVATSIALIWIASPLSAGIATVVGVGLIVITRMVSLGSITGMTAYFAAVLTFYMDNIPLVVFSGMIWLLLLIRHAENIKRLLRNEEKPLFKSKV